MDVESDLLRDLQIDEQDPMPHSNPSRSIPRVSLSPIDAIVNTTSTPSPPDDSAPPPPKETKKKKKKKKKATPAAKPLDTSNNRCFTFIREEVFESKLFSKGKADLYSRADMDKFDRSFQKQLLFNFSERRASKKKIDSVGRASRSQAFNLDENLDVFNGQCTNFQDLSRYILEDVIKCKSGEQFLLCLPTC
jgi:hypothetical protein